MMFGVSHNNTAADRLSLLPADCRYEIARSHNESWNTMTLFDQEFAEYAATTAGKQEYVDLFYKVTFIKCGNTDWSIQWISDRIRSHVVGKCPWTVLNVEWKVITVRVFDNCAEFMIRESREDDIYYTIRRRNELEYYYTISYGYRLNDGPEIIDVGDDTIVDSSEQADDKPINVHTYRHRSFAQIMFMFGIL